MKSKWELRISQDNCLNTNRFNFINIYKLDLMKLIKNGIIVLLSVLISHLNAQILTSTPAFPTQNDTVVIVYDATQGNGALENVTPIWAHTGVITSNSSSDADWQHVVGDWGTSDPDVFMTPIGNNKHQISIPIQSFYDIDDGEEVYKLAFVFRNVDGSIVGRNADGSDIYFDLYNEGNAITIISPDSQTLYAADAIIEIEALSSDSAILNLMVDNIEIAQDSNSNQLTYSLDASVYNSGEHLITFNAEFEDETLVDSVVFYILGEFEVLPLPEGMKEGVNISESNVGEVTFNLFAPGKGLIYLTGDFNDWSFTDDYILNQDTSGDFHWLTVSGLDPQEEYGYQYVLIDESLRTGDPYCEKVLDPWNDSYIDEATYPDLKPYPTDMAQGIVSVFQIEQEEFDWTDESYIRPNKENLIVYELLVRDFLAAHSYQALIDTLNYLDSLGVTAIELMPVNEFEGNESWGYNPNYFFAPDKYYGPKNTYKEFINECHSRGIAVIMDIALNHSFGLSPQVQMYFDPNVGQWGQPTADSPWFNPIPRHDFNVGYDYNHESIYTKKFVDSVLIHWVTEYHIDGYRMDLSKGFTQNNTLGNVAAWGQYDQSRINILSAYADHVWNYDPDIYMILEHFADNDEETVLSDYGFMIWGNINHEYTEAAMGYSSNLNWGSYQSRGWESPHLVSYMESHDEERMMFKNLNYGASNGDYNTSEFGTALKRCELAAVFFFPIPGPKMIWQFGELGYDYSINYCQDGTIDESCRTYPKPIEWDYYDQWQRNRLFRVYQSLIKLKKDYPVFSTDDYTLNVGSYQKTITLNSDDMKVAVLGNFATTSASISYSFAEGGYWYEYFTGDSLLTGDFAPTNVSLEPGEYRLYTNTKISDGLVLGVKEISNDNGAISVYPNPGKDLFTFVLPELNSKGAMLFIYNTSGIIVDQLRVESGKNTCQWNAQNKHPKGMYFVKLQSEDITYTTRIIIQ